MNEKRIISTVNSIARVINSPLIPNNSNYVNSNDTLLHYICDNSLGYVIEFILNVSDKNNTVLNVQDDDGNTPLHLLCSRLDKLGVREDEDFCQTHVNNFISEPSPLKVISMINYLSNYADLSIKNNSGVEPCDLTQNITVHNAYYRQMVRKSHNKFPSPKLINNHIPNRDDWNVLFNLRDPLQKNRTLLHHLCQGDRLSAIKFLVGHGADVQVQSKRNIGHGHSTYMATPLDALFKEQQISLTLDDRTTFTDIKVPSGFRRTLEMEPSSFRRSPEPVLEDYDLYLLNSEKKILKEAEAIARYLVEKGAEFTLNSYCDISDVMYELYKEKNENKRVATATTSIFGGITSVARDISSGLMKYYCFPLGSDHDHKKYNKVKYIRISSLHPNENQESEEKNPFL